MWRQQKLFKAPHHRCSFHWKASGDIRCGLCAAAYHYVPIPPPGTGFPLFPFPVSPLTPTVNTNCERGTKTTRLVSAIVDIQQCTPSKKTIRLKTPKFGSILLPPCSVAVLSTAVSFHIKSAQVTDATNQNQLQFSIYICTVCTPCLIKTLNTLEGGGTLLHVGQKNDATLERTETCI